MAYKSRSSRVIDMSVKCINNGLYKGLELFVRPYNSHSCEYPTSTFSDDNMQSVACIRMIEPDDIIYSAETQEDEDDYKKILTIRKNENIKKLQNMKRMIEDSFSQNNSEKTEGQYHGITHDMKKKSFLEFKIKVLEKMPIERWMSKSKKIDYTIPQEIVDEYEWKTLIDTFVKLYDSFDKINLIYNKKLTHTYDQIRVHQKLFDVIEFKKIIYCMLHKYIVDENTAYSDIMRKIIRMCTINITKDINISVSQLENIQLTKFVNILCRDKSFAKYFSEQCYDTLEVYYSEIAEYMKWDNHTQFARVLKTKQFNDPKFYIWRWSKFSDGCHKIFYDIAQDKPLHENVKQISIVNFYEKYSKQKYKEVVKPDVKPEIVALCGSVISPIESEWDRDITLDMIKKPKIVCDLTKSIEPDVNRSKKIAYSYSNDVGELDDVDDAYDTDVFDYPDRSIM